MSNLSKFLTALAIIGLGAVIYGKYKSGNKTTLKKKE
jgi:hypothetical protein